MARIPDAFIDDLLARSDIVEVVGSRVPLKRQGREYSARCPFHDERSPSFTVSPTKQFYHCFGCGAHGTAISFLMNYDRLEFLDAVEELAKRAGLEVPRDTRQRNESGESKDLYGALHRLGHAHSVEAWEGDELVGGLYGVTLGSAYFGESMFSRRTNASKICLVYLVERLKERGFTLLDTQFTTEHLKTFGAVDIPKDAFDQKMLPMCLQLPTQKAPL